MMQKLMKKVFQPAFGCARTKKLCTQKLVKIHNTYRFLVRDIIFFSQLASLEGCKNEKSGHNYRYSRHLIYCSGIWRPSPPYTSYLVGVELICQSHSLEFFLMLALLRRTSFLTTIYFSHQYTHITK